MKTSDFDFELPLELIAQTPLTQRDASRLMHIDKNSGEIEHLHFGDIKKFLRAGDCLVMNNSRVLPARLLGTRSTGAAIELLLLKELGDDTWECLGKPGRKLQKGAEISFGEGILKADVIKSLENGNKIVKFSYEGIFLEILEKLGEMPLPPYIKEKLTDNERYQTVYSKELGSAAAPTAGLHFTNELLSEIEAMGVKICFVTLHVGLGTFRPVKVDDVLNHDMHSEYCIIDEVAAQIITDTKKSGGRVICAGTTSCRTIESFANEDGTMDAKAGDTNIFIYPSYRFKCMDGLITNFHLPESTLLMLVAAFCGKEEILKAYDVAVAEKYRFFSFGDAMILI